MLIDRHIGYDEEDGIGIMGDTFCRELLFLDTLNKSKINIWIHSPGGKVSDGEKIVAAILKSKTKVDTHNVGMAASIAGPIWLAGRNRYMMDFAKFMMHPVGNSTDEKQRKAFEDSVVTMLSSRVDISSEVIRRMVNETTWLNATQCEALGICTVEASSSHNRPRKAFDPVNFSESYKDFTSVVNRLVQEKKQQQTPEMDKITNKLGLVSGSNEGQILSAIEQIENKNKEAASKLLRQEEENRIKVETLNKALTDVTAERDTLKTKVTEIENREREAKAAEAKSKATEAITNAVKDGKIKNDEKAISIWVENYEKNPEGTANIIADLPVNKAMPGGSRKEEKTPADSVPYTAAGVMAKIAIENKQTRI